MSSTVVETPLARSRRPTVAPKLPNPAISTAPSSWISSASRSGASRRLTRAPTRSLTSSSSGVIAIDSATAATSGPLTSRLSTPS